MTRAYLCSNTTLLAFCVDSKFSLFSARRSGQESINIREASGMIQEKL